VREREREREMKSRKEREHTKKESERKREGERRGWMRKGGGEMNIFLKDVNMPRVK